jgi:tripeptidyl-peptidase-1
MLLNHAKEEMLTFWSSSYITPGVKLTQVVKRTVERKRGFPGSSKTANRWPTTKPPPDGFPWNYIPPGAGSLPPDLQACGRNFTPVCMKALYQIPPATKATPGNTLGLFEQGDYFAKEDLDLTRALFAPWVPQGVYPIPALIDGANYSVPPYSPLNTGESDIDMDIA